jgi:asparagine N-glycosylation enzyme membrane subunit Stt3
MKRIYLLLLLVLVAGAALRLYHPAVFDKPLKYDSYYHVRVAQEVLDTGALPAEDPWPEGGRPHIYPPLYHLLVALASMLSGIGVFDITRFLLPAFASLTALPVYYLVSK